MSIIRTVSNTLTGMFILAHNAIRLLIQKMYSYIVALPASVAISDTSVTAITDMFSVPITTSYECSIADVSQLSIADSIEVEIASQESSYIANVESILVSNELDASITNYISALAVQRYLYTIARKLELSITNKLGDLEVITGVIEQIVSTVSIYIEYAGRLIDRCFSLDETDTTIKITTIEE